MPVALPAGVYLRPGSAIFQLRIGVPKDLQQHFRDPKTGKPKTDAYRKSLETSDRDEAITRALRIIAEYRERFQALRDKSRPAPFVALTPALEAYITRDVERFVLELDDYARANPRIHTSRKFAKRLKVTAALENRDSYSGWDAGSQRMTPGQLEIVAGLNLDQRKALQLAAATGNTDIARRFADEACAALSVRVEWDTEDGQLALQRIMRALVRAWQGITQRDQGEPVDTPPELPPPDDIPKASEEPATPVEPAAPPVTLRDVLPSWKTRTSAKPNAISRAEHALKLFEQAVGAVPVTELTKASGAMFVRFLLDEKARGFGRKTANNHASAISALMNIAVKDDLIPLNPFDLSIDASVGAEKREPWTDEQLKRIYSHKLFSDSMSDTPRWHDVDPADGRALLLMLLHTGARIGEIAQLRREDFLTRNGIVAIKITAEAGTVKTQESERVVPLAGHLLADPWFSNWLEGVMGHTGDAMPSMCGRARGPSDTAGQWFRYFRKAVGLPSGPLEGSHKFRHWIRSALAEKHVGEATADAITGHAATGSSGRKVYTATASLRAMREALDRLEYPGASPS